MDLPANHPQVAWKKFWCRFPKCTVRYKSYLVSVSAERFQKSPAKCPAFSCHFLPSMLCVPAPCDTTASPDDHTCASIPAAHWGYRAQQSGTSSVGAHTSGVESDGYQNQWGSQTGRRIGSNCAPKHRKNASKDLHPRCQRRGESLPAPPPLPMQSLLWTPHPSLTA